MSAGNAVAQVPPGEVVEALLGAASAAKANGGTEARLYEIVGGYRGHVGVRKLDRDEPRFYVFGQRYRVTFGVNLAHAKRVDLDHSEGAVDAWLGRCSWALFTLFEGVSSRPPLLDFAGTLVVDCGLPSARHAPIFTKGDTRASLWVIQKIWTKDL